MNEREQEVYNLLVNARDIARDANDRGAMLSIESIMSYIDNRSELERTGKTEKH